MIDLWKVREHLVVSTRATAKRCAAAQRGGELTRVWRQVLLDTSCLAGLGHQWRVFELATVARAFAVQIVLGPRAVISHQTAALCHGVEVCDELMDVHVCDPRARGVGRMVLPRIQLPDFSAGIGIVPEARLLRHQARLDPAWMREGPAGLRLVDPVTAAVQASMEQAPREGVIVVSGTLRQCAAFNRFSEKVETSRAREEEVRELLFRRLREAPGRRGVRKAMAVIAAADAACESVAERELLWILKAAGFREVRTQVVHVAGRKEYYVDFELPEHRIVVEFDGEGKRGRSVVEILRSYDREAIRQKDLEALGYIVLRARGRELRSPELIVGEIVRRAGLSRPPRPVRPLGGR